MAVPAHDERDFEFARAFGLPTPEVVEPPADWLGRQPGPTSDEWGEAYDGPGRAVNSANADVSLDGLDTEAAKASDHRLVGATRGQAGGPSPTSCATGCSAVSATGANRSRSCTTTPGDVYAVPVDAARRATRADHYEPEVSDDPDDLTVPQPPLARAKDWVEVTLDLGDGPKQYRRETNTMPQWAGSCWYYLRYLDPNNDDHLVDPEIERYWMGGRGWWRRPVRRRGRARRPAPAVRAVLAQGAVRPRARVDARAVPPALQPGLRAGRGLRRRAGRLRRRRRRVEERDGGSSTREPRHARVRQDGQEPEELRHPRRDVRRLRRRHAAVVRDVQRPARREPPVGDRAT